MSDIFITSGLSTTCTTSISTGDTNTFFHSFETAIDFNFHQEINQLTLQQVLFNAPSKIIVQMRDKPKEDNLLLEFEKYDRYGENYSSEKYKYFIMGSEQSITGTTTISDFDGVDIQIGE